MWQDFWQIIFSTNGGRWEEVIGKRPSEDFGRPPHIVDSTRCITSIHSDWSNWRVATLPSSCKWWTAHFHTHDKSPYISLQVTLFSTIHNTFNTHSKCNIRIWQIARYCRGGNGPFDCTLTILFSLLSRAPCTVKTSKCNILQILFYSHNEIVRYLAMFLLIYLNLYLLFVMLSYLATYLYFTLFQLMHCR